MSKSLFDLITENDYKPFLQKLVKETIYKIIGKWLGFIAIIIAIIAGYFEITKHFDEGKMKGKDTKGSTVNDSAQYYKNKFDSLSKRYGKGN